MTPSPAARAKGLALPLLILGGTTEASSLARAMAGRADITSLLSFAGRTENPVAPPIPHRIGGFGGAAGLAAFLREKAIGAVVDATHPFAARISANAVAACAEAGVPLAVYSRPAWTAGPADRWISAADIDTAISALWEASSEQSLLPSLRGARATKQSSPSLLDCFASLAMTARNEPLSIFLTTGRLDLARFQAAPQHHYLIRTIDPPDPNDIPPHVTVILARPPFAVADEDALMRAHGIDLLVTKNSGGTASAAKLIAARELGLPVLMIERPPPSGACELQDLDAVLAWIDAHRRP